MKKWLKQLKFGWNILPNSQSNLWAPMPDVQLVLKSSSAILSAKPILSPDPQLTISTSRSSGKLTGTGTVWHWTRPPLDNRMSSGQPNPAVPSHSIPTCRGHQILTATHKKKIKLKKIHLAQKTASTDLHVHNLSKLTGQQKTIENVLLVESYIRGFIRL